MTVTASNVSVSAWAAALVLFLGAVAAPLRGEEPVFRVRLAPPAPAGEMKVEVLRWSTDAERAQLAAAIAAPPAPPAPPADAAAPGRGGRAGGRGGRGAAPPPSPAARVTTAVQAAPTVGYIWGDGPTGFSIKYAWRAALDNGRERVVLVTDRRLDPSTAPADSSAANADAAFTVLEMRIDGKGVGEAKTSHAIPRVDDPAAAALSLDGYDAAPGALKVQR